jgi:hypothetical protein
LAERHELWWRSRAALGERESRSAAGARQVIILAADDARIDALSAPGSRACYDCVAQAPLIAVEK